MTTNCPNSNADDCKACLFYQNGWCEEIKQCDNCGWYYPYNAKFGTCKLGNDLIDCDISLMEHVVVKGRSCCAYFTDKRIDRHPKMNPNDKERLAKAFRAFIGRHADSRGC